MFSFTIKSKKLHFVRLLIFLGGLGQGGGSGGDKKICSSARFNEDWDKEMRAIISRVERETGFLLL